MDCEFRDGCLYGEVLHIVSLSPPLHDNRFTVKQHKEEYQKHLKYSQHKSSNHSVHITAENRRSEIAKMSNSRQQTNGNKIGRVSITQNRKHSKILVMIARQTASVGVIDISYKVIYVYKTNRNVTGLLAVQSISHTYLITHILSECL